jgi:hypothetical protein
VHLPGWQTASACATLRPFVLIWLRHCDARIAGPDDYRVTTLAMQRAAGAV